MTSLPRLALGQALQSRGRLAGAVVALTVTITFLTLALVLARALDQSGRVTGVVDTSRADLVIDTAGASVAPPPDLAARAGAVEGVAGVYEERSEFYGVSSTTAVSYLYLGILPPDADLTGRTLSSGTWPGPGQVALTEEQGRLLRVSVGEEVQLDLPTASPPARGEVTVSGFVVDTPVTPTLLPDGYVNAADAEALGVPHGPTVFLTLDPHADPAAVAHRVRAQVGPEMQVITAQEFIDGHSSGMSEVGWVVRAIGLAVGAVAAFVAGLVVTSTFGVLIRQRTQEMALLRLVGATRTQLRTLVLLEAAVVGAVAGVLGLTCGALLMLIAQVALPSVTPLLPATAMLVPHWWEVLALLAFSVVLPVVAAARPTRLLARVDPAAAWRRAQMRDDPPAGRVRTLAGFLLAVAGWALIAWGVRTAGHWVPSDRMLPPELLGLLGGVVSFLGFTLMARAVLTPLIEVLGRAWAVVVPARHRLPLHMALADARRHRLRVAASATALVVGTTLVVTLAGGARSANVSVTRYLEEHSAADAYLRSSVAAPQTSLTEAQVRATARVPGVRAVVPVEEGPLLETTGLSMSYSALPSQQIGGALDADPVTAAVRDGVLVVGEAKVRDLSTLVGRQVRDGTRLELGPDRVPVSVRTVSAAVPTVLLSTATAHQAFGPQPVYEAWVTFEPGTDLSTGADLIGQVQQAASAAEGPSVYATGPAQENSTAEELIDSLLVMLLALVAVTLLIAVVGIASTLTLSVLERRHEHALLRAVGLTRRQLLASLAAEAVPVGLVSAMTGVLLGLGYGAAGSAIALASLDMPVPGLQVPWRTIALVVGGSVLAALTAFLAPACAALRTGPAHLAVR